MASLLIAAPILLSLTLLTSGLAKLGARQGTEDAMTSLRLPLRAFHGSVASVLPVVEIVLALVLWVPFVPLQVMVAVLVALLMLTYLLIIGRALTWDEAVECSCFGTLASPTVSRTTLGRNLALSALGLLGVVAAASGVMTRALVQEPLALVSLGVALLVAIVLTALAIGGTTPEADATASSPTARPGAAGSSTPAVLADSADVEGSEEIEGSEEVDGSDPVGSVAGPDGEEELLDYERDKTPAGVLQRPDGSLITLRQLTSQQAALLLFASEGCGPCERVLDQTPRWIQELSPYMQVTPVFSRPLDQLRERTTERVGEHALHDLQFSARESLGARGAPSAVLIGADGLLAGGPVTGGSTVIEFVEEILTQLHGAQVDGELPATPA